MRLAKLYELIGHGWFHSRVHDAVLHCLQHELTEFEPVGQNAFLLPVAENSVLDGALRSRPGAAMRRASEGRSDGDSSGLDDDPPMLSLSGSRAQ